MKLVVWIWKIVFWSVLKTIYYCRRSLWHKAKKCHLTPGQTELKVWKIWFKFLLSSFNSMKAYVIIFPTLFIGWFSTAYSCQQFDDRVCWFLREFSGTLLFKWAQYFRLRSRNSVSLLSEQGFTNASLIFIYNHSLFFFLPVNTGACFVSKFFIWINVISLQYWASVSRLSFKLLCPCFSQPTYRDLSIPRSESLFSLPVNIQTFFCLFLKV